MFINKEKSRFAIIVAYVDDFNIIGTPEEILKAEDSLKKEFEKKEFEKKDLKKIKVFSRPAYLAFKR